MKTRLHTMLLLAFIQPGASALAQEGSTASAAAAQTASAIFAGGCFWCLEADFEKLPGVLAAQSGYTGGGTAHPTYEQVSAGGTGHAESVRVSYDPGKLSYATLLDYFWHHIDPTVKDRQFCDVGNQYRSAIFYDNDAQRSAAEASKAALLKSGQIRQIYTEIVPAKQFYVAEEYHQDYYRKNPIRYRYYRANCGRDARVAQVWDGKH